MDSSDSERFNSLQACDACTEEYKEHDMVNISCRHSYCKDCMSKLVRTALVEESMFPPMCCMKEITLSNFQDILAHDLVIGYMEKAMEYRTISRTYCASTTCSKFIRPDLIFGSVGVCSACNVGTCTACKAFQHEGLCSPEVGLQDLLEMAKEEGWAQCPSCKRMIEREGGCNHMT